MSDNRCDLELDEFYNIINCPANIKELRNYKGLSLKECAKIFGMTVRAWQKREEPVTSKSYLKLDHIYFNYLLLLTDKHPDLCLKPKINMGYL